MRSVLGLLLILLSPAFSLAQTVVLIKDYTEWQCPPGVTSIMVECWGAGAPSGRVTEQGKQNSWSGGGGGGAYAKSLLMVMPGKKYSASPAISSSFQTSFAALVVADGGLPGQVLQFPGDAQTAIAAGGKGGSVARSKGDIVFPGGDGGRGGIQGAGGGGGVAGPGGPGAPGADGNGMTGGAPGGNGSRGHSFNDAAKDYGDGVSYVQPAGFPGGGMGGGLGRSTPNGGKGLIRITY